MTLIWLAIWLIANNVGGGEPLALDPVNVWTATLILAMALDLGRHTEMEWWSRSGGTKA